MIIFESQYYVAAAVVGDGDRCLGDSCLSIFTSEVKPLLVFNPKVFSGIINQSLELSHVRI